MADELICLDSSVLIDYFRKTKKENSFFFELSNQYPSFAVSVITEFEILSGSNQNLLERRVPFAPHYWTFWMEGCF